MRETAEGCFAPSTTKTGGPLEAAGVNQRKVVVRGYYSPAGSGLVSGVSLVSVRLVTRRRRVRRGKRASPSPSIGAASATGAGAGAGATGGAPVMKDGNVERALSSWISG